MKHPCLPQLSLKGKKMGQFLLDADSPEAWRPPLSCVAKMPRAVLVLCTHSPRDLQALQQVCRAWHGGRHRAFHPAQPPHQVMPLAAKARTVGHFGRPSSGRLKEVQPREGSALAQALPEGPRDAHGARPRSGGQGTSQSCRGAVCC